MQLSRARFLSSDGTMIQGAKSVSVALNMTSRAREYSIPFAARGEVHRAELPLAQRILDARLKTALLLLVADLEPKLHQDDAVVDDGMFELGAKR